MTSKVVFTHLSRLLGYPNRKSWILNTLCRKVIEFVKKFKKTKQLGPIFRLCSSLLSQSNFICNWWNFCLVFSNHNSCSESDDGNSSKYDIKTKNSFWNLLGV